MKLTRIRPLCQSLRLRYYLKMSLFSAVSLAGGNFFGEPSADQSVMSRLVEKSCEIIAFGQVKPPGINRFMDAGFRGEP